MRPPHDLDYKYGLLQCDITHLDISSTLFDVSCISHIFDVIVVFFKYGWRLTGGFAVLSFSAAVEMLFRKIKFQCMLHPDYNASA